MVCSRAADAEESEALQYFTCCGPGSRGAICSNATARTAYNRFNRWSRRGVWKRIFDALAAQSRDSLYLIDSTIVKAHRAASGAKGGRKIRRLASAVVGGPRKSMRSSMARVDH